MTTKNLRKLVRDALVRQRDIAPHDYALDDLCDIAAYRARIEALAAVLQAIDGRTPRGAYFLRGMATERDYGAETAAELRQARRINQRQSDY